MPFRPVTNIEASWVANTTATSMPPPRGAIEEVSPLPFSRTAVAASSAITPMSRPAVRSGAGTQKQVS